MAETIDTILKHDYCQHKGLIDVFNTLFNRVLGPAGISQDGVAPQDVETDNAINFVINGIFYTLAAQNAIDISALVTASKLYDADGDAQTAMTVQADDYDCLYVFSVNSAGDIIVTQTTAVATGGDLPFPTIPSGYVPFGAVKVVNASNANFTFGTTSLATAGLTNTYYDISAMLPGVEF